MTDIDALIEKLEAATEWSRELDAEIFYYLVSREASVTRTVALKPDGSVRDGVPHYTTSLDAALTLVPEDWTWTVGRITYEEHYARPKGPGYGAQLLHNTDADLAIWVKARASAPLALCIAALRAIKAKETGE